MSGITKRQAHLIDMAATHADDFKTRVARHDEESSFPHENMQAMKNSGYSAFVVPKKFGGLEATPLETAMAQERLAYGDLPTAIAINMHIISLSMVTDLWWLAEKEGGENRKALEGLLKAAVDESIIFAAPVSDPKMNSSIGFAGVNDTTRQAKKVDGGYVVSGKSGFGTMSAGADYILTTARYLDPDGGPQILLCFFPAQTEGIAIQNNWDTMSIRSSQSNDVLWNDVFISKESVIARPVRTWDALANVTASRWIASGPACYIGLAQAARDYAVDWITDRNQEPFDQPMTHYPGNQLLVAEMEIGIRSSRAMLHQTVVRHDSIQVRSGDDLVNLISCYQFVMESCFQVVDKAMRVVGGAALFKKNPLEQMYRDARAAIIHQPFGGMENKALLGRCAMGLPVYSTPRFV